MIYRGIPDIRHLEEWTELKIPFEYNDFMLPGILEQKHELKERIKQYLSVERDRREDTIHGPFLDITVHSSDSMIYKASDYRIRQVCEIALELQAKAIILHTNFIPNFYEPNYRRGWVDRNEAYMRKLLEDYPGLQVYMENMFDEEPDCLAALAKRMEGERFWVCLDLAHAHISKTEIEIWQEMCRPYVAHYHINDNFGKIDEHLPIGEGNIPWESVLPEMKKQASVLVEVSSLEKYKKSVEYLKKIESISQISDREGIKS